MLGLFKMISLIEKIKVVRKITGISLLNCKNALLEADGDVKKALDLLKFSTILCAQKKICLQTKCGAVFCAVSNDFLKGVLVELLCETDFVAKNSEFLQILKKITFFCLNNNITCLNDLNFLNNITEFNGMNFESFRCTLVTKFGENIQFTRLHSVTINSGFLGSYIHYRNDIPVFCSFVALKVGDMELANNIAIHVIVSNPTVVNFTDLPVEKIEEKRDFFVKEFFKEKCCTPTDDNINIFLKKHFQDEVLFFQPYVFDDTKSINTLLLEKGNCVLFFKIFRVNS